MRVKKLYNFFYRTCILQAKKTNKSLEECKYCNDPIHSFLVIKKAQDLTRLFFPRNKYHRKTKYYYSQEQKTKKSLQKTIRTIIMNDNYQLIIRRLL